MSDGDALLRAILEHPAEDTPRLMYADWLEDVNGGNDAARAEFIRGAITYPHCSFVELTRADPFPLLGLVPAGKVDIGGIVDGMLNFQTWMWGEVDGFGCAIHDLARNVDYREDRGFISAIRCPLSAFMEHAEALFRAHPIERVTLTDRRPLRFTPDAGSASFDWPDRFAWIVATDWQLPGPDSLPRDLWEHLQREAYSNRSKRYDTESEAIAGLSDACVAYGRSLAGLSPLPDVESHTP